MKTGRGTFSPAMEWAVGYNRWIVESFGPALRGTILEVGFGHEGLRHLLPEGTECISVDVDAEVVARARDAHPDRTVLLGDIAEPGFPDLLADRRADAVLCVNVLEHVADHQRAVSNLLSCLRPGGSLCLFVPAFSWLYNDLDRLAGHLRRYRLAQVECLVPRDLGEVCRIEYFNPIGGFGWWLNGLVRHRELTDRAVTWQVVVFDRVARPVSQLLNPITRRVFGQSVLAVIERR